MKAQNVKQVKRDFGLSSACVIEIWPNVAVVHVAPCWWAAVLYAGACLALVWLYVAGLWLSIQEPSL